MKSTDRTNIRFLLMGAGGRLLGALIIIAVLWVGYFLVTSGAA